MQRQIATCLITLCALTSLAACGGSAEKLPASLPRPQSVASGISRESIRPQPSNWRARQALSLAADSARTTPASQTIVTHTVRGTASIPGLDKLILPRIPQEDASSNLKNVSDTHVANLTSPFDDSGNITTTPTLLTLTSAAGGASWAVFKFPYGPAEVSQLLQYHGQMTAAPNGAKSGLWIGLPNYTKQRWELQGPQTVGPTTSITLSGVAPYLSPSRNLYVLVLAYGGDVIELSQLAVVTSNPLPPLLPDEFGFALSYVGLDESKIGLDQIFAGLPGANQWTWQDGGGNPYKDLFTMMDTYWNAWYVAPAAFPQYVKDKGDALGATQSIQDLLISATDEFQSEHRITPQTHSETLDPGQPLAKAIADLVTSAGGVADQPTYQTAVGALSLPNQNALAVVVEATRRALVDRNQTMADYNTNSWGGSLDQPTLDGWFASMHGKWLSNATEIPVVYDVSSNFRFLRTFPYEGFFTPAARLADALDALTAYVATNPVFEDVNLDVATPAGNITIGGTGPDTHTSPGANGHLLLFDLGGSDTYNCNAGGTASYANGVSVCVDFSGDDVYNRMDDPSTPDRTVTPSDDNTSQQGAGRLGIGILVDYAGDDQYYSVRMSQGAAVLGVGIMADMGGNDLRTMEALGQGAAIGGVGICYDKEGSGLEVGDENRSFQFCGGYGGMMGVGFMVDQGSTGQDTYHAERTFDPTKPEYQSGFDTTLNNNFCFGSAFGKQKSGDATVDPVVGSGGFGLCYDDGGDDTYEVGAIGQGAAYYQCVGICFDNGGIDSHTGDWWSQGAAVQYGIAALWDGGGNDTYTNSNSLGIGGAAVDSIAWFLERDGDDTYNASNLCLGRGASNANGFLIDWLGSDTYTPTEANGYNSTLGRGGDATTGPTTGIFVDVKGADNYDASYAGMLSGTNASDGTPIIATPPADLTHWIRDGGAYTAGGFYAEGHGCGYDGE